jgi:hypothetical protein
MFGKKNEIAGIITELLAVALFSGLIFAAVAGVLW